MGDIKSSYWCISAQCRLSFCHYQFGVFIELYESRYHLTNGKKPYRYVF